MTQTEINSYYQKKEQEKTSSEKLEVPYHYVFKPNNPKDLT